MSRPAPAGRAVGALAAMELRLTARRAENVLVVVVVPAAVLAFFSSVAVLTIPGRAVDFLLPGAIALGIAAAGFVNLGIATAYERHYGVLKRLGGAPVTPSLVLAAKVVAVLVVVGFQVVLLVAVAVGALGWAPGGGSAPLAVVTIVVGTVAFAGLGVALAGALRAEAVLAVANGLFLLFLLLGGIVLPLDHLPEPLAAVGRLLPVTALADALRIAFGAAAGDAVPSLGLLGAWGLAGWGLVARTFSWD